MIWIIDFIITLLFSAFAFLTSPIVILFSNKEGELPKIFNWWKTPDNPLDVEWHVKTTVPECIRYDFDKHYISYQGDTSLVMVPRWVVCINPHFTFKERIQRYFCRLFWLSRNTAYGFAWYVMGRQFIGANQVIIHDDTDTNWLSYLPGNVFTRTWSYWRYVKWCPWFYLRLYVGWKMKGKVNIKEDRAMIAICINPFRR